MRFDLTDLRLFLCVVDASSITRGAERAHLALASASARLRGMEDASGIALLERHARGVAPTAAGLALAHHARVVLAQLEQMRGDLGQYAAGLRGHVRLLSNTAALTDLPDLLGRFLIEHPTIDVDLEEKQSHAIVAALAGGLADVGLLVDTGELALLETRPYRVDRLVLVVSERHRLANAGPVVLRDVLNEAFVGLSHGSALQSHLAAHASRAGRPFKLRVRLGGLDAICAMVEAGVGIAVIPEVAVARYGSRRAIASVRLDEPWASRQLVICARRFDALSAHASDLVHMLEGSVDTPSPTASPPVRTARSA